MAKRKPKSDSSKPAKKNDRHDPLSDSVHGVPTGVSFGTREGRRAQGMVPDFQKKPRLPHKKKDKPETQQ
jgi:hypothetical protein